MKQWCRQLFANGLVILQIMLLVGAPTALLLVHVWNQYRVAEVGYEIAEATERHQQLLEENKKLTVEARLQGRSDRVAELAREQFGLREAQPNQVVTIDDKSLDTPEEHASLQGVSHGGERPLVRQ